MAESQRDPLPAPGSRFPAARTYRRPPLPVVVIACAYIVMGAVGFFYHLKEFEPQRPLQDEFIWIELVRLLAVVSGVFMLRGRNWARWLALAWMAFHVILSAFHTVQELVVHAVLLVVLAVFLLGAAADRFFSRSVGQPFRAASKQG